jgi:predicted AlkP superfamily phosphohydrolase/phosphomutase
MHKNKIFILALDGVPYTFLKTQIQSGEMPHLARVVKNGTLREMNSVIPPVSSAAWASFLTGKNPDQHGILSFTERNPYTMDWFTPDAQHLKGENILQVLSKMGKKVFSMNVPVTYPPIQINGISICGFLGNDIEKGTYPLSEGKFLKEKGYRIDANTELAKTDLAAFITDLNQVLEKRIEILWHYFEKEQWDFFMVHIMETDRLHHFTWEFRVNNDPLFVNIYNKFYAKLDSLIGEIYTRIDVNSHFMLLSDHGFTTLKQEVYLNRWLWENDYLKFSKPFPESLHDIHPASKAYALYPGRIFINLKGREKNGSVNPGKEYENLRGKIKEHLAGLTCPKTKEKVMETINNVEDVYDPANIDPKYFADIFAFAKDGYELKGQLWNNTLFSKTYFNGMHSFDNAFMISSGFDLPEEKFTIADSATIIYNCLKIK